MGLFHEIKKAGKKFDKWVNKDLGGWGNIATSAGIILAGVATGGLAAGAGYSALVSLGAAGAGTLAGTGYGISGAEAHKDELKAEKLQKQQQAEVDKANAIAERQRRANLYSLRKQVGATNVGTSSVGGGSSTDDTMGVKLG